MSGLMSEALPDCLHAKPRGGRLRRWGTGGGRVRVVAVATVLAVTAAAAAALGPAGPAAAISATSYAEAWGQGIYSALGNGSTADQYSPVHVTALSQVTQVSSGFVHTLAVRADGTVWAWGDNGDGELGNGTNTPSSVPVQVPGLTGIVQVAAGHFDSLALRSDGTVWAWGTNGYGQLGDGTTTPRTTPVQVAGLTGVTQIAAGFDHSLALRSDGAVVAWGYNVHGELGDGTPTDHSTTPVAVSGLTNATQIGGGYYHSLALRSDGTVVAWGSNFEGQLGDGKPNDSATPVQVAGLTNVTQIAAGAYHGLALRSDGTAAAWGDNQAGALGDGTPTNRTTPITVSGLTGVAQVSAGYLHSAALRADGTVWAWGNNGEGELGDGTKTIRYTPVAVPGLSSVTQVSAGGFHTVAIVGPPELTAKATITGTGKVGATLTCKATFIGATSVSYTWLLDTTTIPGATTATYTPVAAEYAGRQATCQVTGTNTLGSTGTSATISIHADAAPTATISAPAYTRTSTTTATIAVADTDDPISNLSVSCRMDSAAWTPCAPGAWPIPAQKPGTHVLSVKVTDPSGRTNTFSRTWVVDQLSPTVTMRGPAQPFTLASSIPVSWTGSDSGSGIAYYQVRWNKAAYNGGFGAWQYPAAWQKLTTTTVTLTGVVPAVGYCFQTRAVDKVANTGAWSADKCSAVALDDRSLGASAGWSRVSWSPFYRGTATQTTKTGASLTRPGAALTRVALVATRCPTCGTVGVYVNGTSVGTINLYSTTTARQAVIALPPFSYRTGTVTLKVLSSGKTVQVDGLGISRA
jgi:alpha-tubulin suppressor-like RCC1 family protein